MSDIELIEDAYGSLHPVKTSDLHEYGMDADKSFAGWPSVKAVKKSISSAEILAIHDSPVVVVPAAGPGTVNLLLGYVWRRYPGDNFYTERTSLNMYYTDSNGKPLLNSNEIEIGDTLEDFGFTYHYSFYDAAYDYSSVENQPIVISIDANPESGDGTLDFVAFYITVEI